MHPEKSHASFFATTRWSLVGDAAGSVPEDIAGKFPQFEILECLGRGGMGVV